ncbi:hypothetical protein SCHPADRAFT_690413 [Schizopora paradoxa]|uniref:Uncharacterized protein n=1 Tax=Schizopora paradoxa TaxID=27342 RepID=A0A0H2RAB3_9AGAM|nr:hypothetical protein SCHPADRAFT_690413 [Schizopora paradoxa]
MLSSGSLQTMSPSPSPSTSTSPSNDSSSGYSSPSPSPDLPSPDALQLEYPQYFSYPDAFFSPMPLANQLSLDSTIYSTQAPQLYTDASYYDLSAHEFVQGCSSSSSYSAMATSSSSQDTYYGSQPPYLPEPSFELLPPSPLEEASAPFASSKAKDEWSSFLSAPLPTALPPHSAPEFPALNPIPNDLPDMGSSALFSSGSGFANFSSEFDSFMEEFGV